MAATRRSPIRRRAAGSTPGSATKFTLRPPGKPQAEGVIERISLSEPAVFDEPTMKKLVAEVLASAPGGSTNVTFVSQEKNSFMIAQKETFLVTISYNFYGQNYQRSTMFLNRGNEQCVSSSLAVLLISRVCTWPFKPVSLPGGISKKRRPDAVRPGSALAS